MNLQYLQSIQWSRFCSFFCGLMSLTLLLSCDLNVLPEDSLTQEHLGKEKEGGEYATLGNYTMFKDILNFEGSASTANTYVRHFFQMAEFPGDNATLSGRTSDPLYESATYKHYPKMRNTSYLWWVAYKIIYGANVAIESIPEGKTPEQDQLIGENYFLRALLHFDLSRLFSKPYIQGRDNLGIVLRTNSKGTPPIRATVGDAYDHIVSDLLKATKLLNTNKGAAFASPEAAWALLSRVYLYMGENDKVIEAANEVFKRRPVSNLEPTSNYPNYFKTALASTETLFAIMHSLADNKGQSSIASMYLNDGTGWGEVYASFPYLQLLGKHSNDLRHKFIKPQYVETDPNLRKQIISFEVLGSEGIYIQKAIPVEWNDFDNQYQYTENGMLKYVEKDIQGYYTINLINKKQRVLLGNEMEERYGYSKYFVTKFSYQNDQPMLSSPVMIRLAEVILNRAEAYAKKGSIDLALDDVNLIRKRAGLTTDQLFSNLNMHGYMSVEEIVEDERRLELAFEGHRFFDVFRNNKSMDRRFPGVHPGVIVTPSEKRIIYYIPENEIMVSGLTQNE